MLFELFYELSSLNPPAKKEFNRSIKTILYLFLFSDSDAKCPSEISNEFALLEARLIE